MFAVLAFKKGITLKVPITTAADVNFDFLLFFIYLFSEKTSLDVSCMADNAHEM